MGKTTELVLVNGVSLDLDTPSFNVFSLLKQLQQETRVLVSEQHNNRPPVCCLCVVTPCNDHLVCRMSLQASNFNLSLSLTFATCQLTE